MSTSELQKRVGNLLGTHLGKYTIVEGSRPEWLTSSSGFRLELDFLIRELNIAIEVQGIQHYELTEHFHKGEDGFKEQKRRDEEKRTLCSLQGITLYEVSSYIDTLILIQDILRTANGKDEVYQDETYHRPYPE